MKTLPTWSCLSDVRKISCDSNSVLTWCYEPVAFFRMVYVSTILEYTSTIEVGRYLFLGGHSAMQSLPWGHLWGDWPPAVADLLCLWHRGPWNTCHHMSLLRSLNVNVHVHVLFLVVFLSIECVPNVSYQLFISCFFNETESNLTQFLNQNTSNKLTDDVLFSRVVVQLIPCPCLHWEKKQHPFIKWTGLCRARPWSGWHRQKKRRDYWVSF